METTEFQRSFVTFTVKFLDILMEIVELFGLRNFQLLLTP
jgi:hypothetical protein